MMPEGEHRRIGMREAVQVRRDTLRASRQSYDNDLPAFAAACLKIRPKGGGETMLRLNAVQLLVHEAAEDQLRRIGKVRLLVLKARQEGVSTYIEARLYWKTSRRKGLRAFILTHTEDATDNIFEMAERFHRCNPHAPATGKANAKELVFEVLDSGFAVGTAGSRGTGRSPTFQLFHGSETAFWPNAQEHATGAMQSVPNAPGTEIWLESTAQGVGGLFYNMVHAAIRGQGEFELLFIPWFAHGEYATNPPEGWRAPPQIAEYSNLHGLTRAQTYWCFQKNGELAAADALPDEEIIWRFMQEYPATVEEAFRAARVGSFIPGSLVAKARKWRVPDQSRHPIVLGCDFATGGGGGEGDVSGEGEGGDQNAFIDMQGRRKGGNVYESFRDRDAVSVASRLGRTIDKVRPAMCFLDVGGGGAQVYDILASRGYKKVLTLVNFGARPNDRRKYKNKRAEMWGEHRDWLADPGGVQIPDDDALDGDLTSVREVPNIDRLKQLERKDQVRKKFGFSPDRGDAAALCHAEPIAIPVQPEKHGKGFTVADELAGY